MSYTSQLQSSHSSAFLFTCGDLSIEFEADSNACDSTHTAPLLYTWSWCKPPSASGPFGSLPPMWNIGAHLNESFSKKRDKNLLWPFANRETVTSAQNESGETNETRLTTGCTSSGSMRGRAS